MATARPAIPVMTSIVSPPLDSELSALAAEYSALEAVDRTVAAPDVVLRRDWCAERILVLLDGTLRWAAREVSRNSAEVEDLLQEARIHTLVALRTWREDGGASPRTWVRTHLVHELWRARRRLGEQARHGVDSLDCMSESLSKAVVEAAEDSYLGGGSVVDSAIELLCKRLEPEDVSLIQRLRTGEQLGHAWERGRARALIAHPSNDIPGTEGALISDRASCRGAEPGLYFPRRGHVAPAAVMSMCSRCAVRNECLRIGSARSTWPGIWGGTTHNERRHDVRRTNGEVARDPGPEGPGPHAGR